MAAFPSPLDDAALQAILTEHAVGSTRCYWSIHSADEALTFQYLGLELRAHLGEEAASMIGTSLLDFIHPEEVDACRTDYDAFLANRPLTGTITKCRYSRVPRIRKILGASNPVIAADAHYYVEDDDYLQIHIVSSFITDGAILSFYHAVLNKPAAALEVSADPEHWSNWCGPSASFNGVLYLPADECSALETILATLDRPPTSPYDAAAPAKNVFQILDSRTGAVLVSHPTPASGAIDDYDVELYRNLACDMRRSSDNSNGEATSCTRRMSGRTPVVSKTRTLRIADAVVIPYGCISFAAFQIVNTLGSSSNPQRAQSTDPIMNESRKRPRVEEPASITPSGSPTLSRTSSVTRRPSLAAGGPTGNSSLASFARHRQEHRAQRRASSQGAVLEPGASEPDQPSHPAVSAAAPAPEVAPMPVNYALPAPPYSFASTGYPGPAYGLDHQHDFAHLPSQPIYAPGLSMMPASQYQYPYPMPSYVPLASQAGQPMPAHHRPLPAKAETTPSSSTSSTSSKHPRMGADGLSRSERNMADTSRTCQSCGTSQSPEWRKGPNGVKSLCNACGLKFQREQKRKMKQERTAQERAPSLGPAPPVPADFGSPQPSVDAPAGYRHYSSALPSYQMSSFPPSQPVPPRPPSSSQPAASLPPSSQSVAPLRP